LHFGGVFRIAHHPRGLDHRSVRQPPVCTQQAAWIELRMRRPSRLMFVVDAVVGEKVIDLAFEDAQAPVTVFSLGLKTSFRLHEFFNDPGGDKRLPPRPEADFAELALVLHGGSATEKMADMLRAKVAVFMAVGGAVLAVGLAIPAQAAPGDSPELVDGPDGVCRPTPFSVFCDHPRNTDGSWTRCVRRNPSYPGYYLHAITTCSTLRSGDPVPTGTATGLHR
jgi:hypothetical protein